MAMPQNEKHATQSPKGCNVKAKGEALEMGRSNFTKPQRGGMLGMDG
jgi:hypothetical protein